MCVQPGAFLLGAAAAAGPPTQSSIGHFCQSPTPTIAIVIVNVRAVTAKVL